MAQFEAVPKRQVLQIVGQALLRWHDRPLQQHRRHRDVSFERGRDFLAHEIVRVVQPSLSGGVPDVEPVGADQRQQRVARFEAVMETLPKVAPERDAVDVHEDGRLADIIGEFDRQGSGLSLGISSPVADENPGHLRRLRICWRRTPAGAFGRAAGRAGPGLAACLDRFVCGNHLRERY